jgi:ATP phosphoribosyltransferase
MRGTDVPTYVRVWRADLGVAGKDLLMEYGSKDSTSLWTCAWPLPADDGRLRWSRRPDSRALRVATKFVNVAKRYFGEQGVQIELIKLYGGMELAPLVGLADQIVDIVDTGNTLQSQRTGTAWS